jgi:predicted TIM-barrel fold metal-dependent hydrolase
LIVSKIGTEVIDSHAHFFTYDTIKLWLDRGASLESMQSRVSNLTDMPELTIPDENWDIGQMWADELDRYRITAIGMMVSGEVWDEFNETRKRFPGRFMGYANIDPAEERAVDMVKRAGKDDFQGIKLYPSSWDFHAYDERVFKQISDMATHLTFKSLPLIFQIRTS